MNSISPTLLKQVALELTGLTTRTSNLAEQDMKTQKIGPLWQQFFAERAPILAKGELIYGVYYDYQSDMDGEFSVLAASHVVNECDVTLTAGDYLKFNASGEIPQCVIALWEEVWRYFSSSECEYHRCYLTDYEVYLDANRVEIYIGINP